MILALAPFSTGRLRIILWARGLALTAFRSQKVLCDGDSAGPCAPGVGGLSGLGFTLGARAGVGVAVLGSEKLN